ncbi:lipopolysaccharide-induced tumor necrosis factor-alpha factor homolog [Oreochromis niloticus]|uniref:lipopolysaccharide-induced tumor necrosis factor-alpha factor homolog n=1 Tax=Oreochromis niloticus TaxID=8128 RepID=UPI00025FC4C9|nr:lipopolysaccharide-induced tumor necrosis factor-alpha factor homolog [Oreochromis niloticus]
MEKGQAPNTDLPAPPYPGPPLDHKAGVSQPAVQPVVQPVVQPAVQPVVQPVVQPAVQPVVQPVVQPAVQIVQQPAYQHNAQQPQVVQPVSQVVVMQGHLPKDVPGQMKCPHCQTEVVTKTEYKIGILTWLIFGLLLFMGCWPCYVIPFFVKECKDVEHSCPTCNSVIHIHKYL